MSNGKTLIKMVGLPSKPKPHGLDYPDIHYFISLKYETFNVEEHVESLIYDAGSFLVSVGGNLGLFLGFSCLSVFFAIINVCKHYESLWKKNY
jgi:hypothetical protein